MTEDKLQTFLISRINNGCKLGYHATRGVRACTAKIVHKTELVKRGMEVGIDVERDRQNLEERLQLEVELQGLEAICADDRFSNMRTGEALSDPKRHLIDALHLAMRGNEQMLHIMKVKQLEIREGKENAKEDLMDLDEQLRKMGGLGDKWEHKWEPTNSEKVVKSALPYDESRRIFRKENIDNGQFDAVLTIVFAWCPA